MYIWRDRSITSLTPEQKDAGSSGSVVSALSVNPVPEPDTWALLALGFAVMVALGNGRCTEPERRAHRLAGDAPAASSRIRASRAGG